MRASIPYLSWRITYTLAIIWFGLGFFTNPKPEAGAEAGIIVILCGALPSLFLSVLAYKNIELARKVLCIYGLTVVVMALATLFLLRGLLWLVVFIPMSLFPVEALLIYIAHPVFGGIR